MIMKHFIIFFYFLALLSLVNPAIAQINEQLDVEPEISNENLVLLFAAFITAVVGIFVFLARDIILRRKTAYDSEDFESKKDRTREKYSSDWADDYEDVGSHASTVNGDKFRKDAKDYTLPDYYGILSISRDATQKEIKQQYRRLAKKSHPDKTVDKDAAYTMTEINKAYEVLSDPVQKEMYDRCLDSNTHN